MRGDKLLIVDPSGFGPITYSISEGYMSLNDFNISSVQTNIQYCVTDSVLQAGEFSYSETPNLFTIRPNQILSDTTSFDNNSTLVKACWLISNGTITTLEDRNGLEFKVFTTGDQTSQTNLRLASTYSSKLSPQDESNIYLAIELLNSGTKTAILANDRSLREQAKLLSIPVYGSSSLLAGMVLGGIYSCQKATKLFYKWKRVDKRWVPKNKSFKDVLSFEKERNKDNNSFWFN